MRMGALLIGVVLAAPAFSPSFAKATEGGQDDKAAHNTIACDKKTGDLWVAFVRADPGFDAKFDLTLEMKGVGTWIWKGVSSESEYKVAAKGPDKAPDKK